MCNCEVFIDVHYDTSVALVTLNCDVFIDVHYDTSVTLVTLNCDVLFRILFVSSHRGFELLCANWTQIIT